jgi:flagellar basal body rod protein FlgG
MLYGLYLSATGVMTNAYRQDVIANNIANAETVGFKRDLALFQERRTEARDHGFAPSRTNPLMEALGGGVFASPTLVDRRQGELESTGREMDVAIVGHGYYQVAHGDQVNLTRNGGFILNHRNRLALSSNENFEVLDVKGKPITLDPTVPPVIAKDGTVNQNSRPIAQIAVVDVPDPAQLTKSGGTLMAYPDMQQVRPARDVTLRSEFQERANVEPSSELTQLMEAQRQLEANANMIKYQDQMLSKLVNEVGKIS